MTRHAVLFLLIGFFLSIHVGTVSAQSSADPDAPIRINWDTRGDTWRQYSGQRFKLLCPRGGRLSAQIWGTGFYTDDSSVCTAAVHAGLINTSEGGVVAIVVSVGRESYKGSYQNRIQSQDYGSWPGSFFFSMDTSAPGGAGSPPSEDRRDAVEITWQAPANKFEAAVGTRLVLRCPSGGDVRFRVWGTDIYTDDSAICVAAVHAGLIKVSGGVVTIVIRPGQTRYLGSRRNNVATEDYGSWTRSFSFERN